MVSAFGQSAVDGLDSSVVIMGWLGHVWFADESVEVAPKLQSRFPARIGNVAYKRPGALVMVENSWVRSMNPNYLLESYHTYTVVALVMIPRIRGQ